MQHGGRLGTTRAGETAPVPPYTFWTARFAMTIPTYAQRLVWRSCNGKSMQIGDVLAVYTMGYELARWDDCVYNYTGAL